MNKIYKLVWSKVRNTWVVASEMAKGHGKSSSPEGKGIILKSMILMALFGCFMTAGISSVAAELTGDQKVVYDAVMAELKSSGRVQLGGTTTDSAGIAIGADSLSKGDYSTAIGSYAQALAGHSVTIGDSAVSNGGQSVAMGHFSRWL